MNRFVEYCHYALGVISFIVLGLIGLNEREISLIAGGVVSCILFFGIGTIINFLYRIWLCNDPKEDEEEIDSSARIILIIVFVLAVLAIIFGVLL